MFLKKNGYIGFFFDLMKAKLFSVNIPLIVALNITNRCNLNCTYCYGDYYNRKTRDFTKQELFDLIETLYKMGTRIIYLSGGEPLLRKDVGEIIDTIKSKNMLCFLNSNGLLVPNKLNEIKNIDSLTISLDGKEDVNDKNRGQGTYKRAVKAIEVAKDAGIHVATNTVINQDTLYSVDYVISLANKLGFTAEFNLPYAQSMGNKNNPILCSFVHQK